MSKVAKSKLAYLRERGYEQVAVVVAGPGGCCTVSDSGRVQWFGALEERRITGAETTHAERLDGEGTRNE